MPPAHLGFIQCCVDTGCGAEGLTASSKPDLLCMLSAMYLVERKRKVTRWRRTPSSVAKRFDQEHALVDSITHISFQLDAHPMLLMVRCGKRVLSCSNE